MSKQAMSKRILLVWRFDDLISCCLNRGYSEEQAEQAGGTIYAFGSYRWVMKVVRSAREQHHIPLLTRVPSFWIPHPTVFLGPMYHLRLKQTRCSWSIIRYRYTHRSPKKSLKRRFLWEISRNVEGFTWSYGSYCTYSCWLARSYFFQFLIRFLGNKNLVMWEVGLPERFRGWRICCCVVVVVVAFL